MVSQLCEAESSISNECEEVVGWQEDKTLPKAKKVRRIMNGKEEKRESSESSEALKNMNSGLEESIGMKICSDRLGTVSESRDKSLLANMPVESSEEEEDSDVFLQLARNSFRNSQRKSTRKRSAEAKSQGSRCTHPHCPSGKTCARYQRGGIGCYTPSPPAAVQAAEKRIANLEQAPIVLQLKRDVKMRESASFRLGKMEMAELEGRIETARTSSVVRQMESERAFVGLYEKGIEERCAKGRWWERWAVLE